MKIVKRAIKAAEDITTEDKLKSKLAELKDEFDFALQGLEYIGKGSIAEAEEALIIADRISDAVNGIINEIAETVEQNNTQE